MSKQIVYCYPAFLKPKADGYDVSFVDFKDCKTHGKDILEAIENGRETLSMHIDQLLNKKVALPDPSKLETIKVGKKEVLVMIDFNINVYRHKNKTKAITRAVTLPINLNEKVKASNINVSALLQETLKEKLGIEED